MADYGGLLTAVRHQRPLVHCITNPISISFMADALAALGARPLMAAYAPEIQEIGADAAALLLNLGNITADRMDAMVAAVKAACTCGRPAVLDLNGVAASSIRRHFAERLLSTGGISCIKGNYSEVLALGTGCHYGGGVDSVHGAASAEEVKGAAIELARRYDTGVFVSGAIDCVTDGRQMVELTNGSSAMGRVVGTGCVLGALIAAFSAVGPITEAASAAGILWGICGEETQMTAGPRHYASDLVAALYLATPEIFRKARTDFSM